MFNGREHIFRASPLTNRAKYCTQSDSRFKIRRGVIVFKCVFERAVAAPLSIVSKKDDANLSRAIPLITFFIDQEQCVSSSLLVPSFSWPPLRLLESVLLQIPALPVSCLTIQVCFVLEFCFAFSFDGAPPISPHCSSPAVTCNGCNYDNQCLADAAGQTGCAPSCAVPDASTACTR